MVFLKNKQIVLFITILVLSSCVGADKKQLSEVTGNQISIDSTITATESIDAMVAPFRNRINTILDSTLAYAPKPLTKDDGDLNSSIGNLMADIVDIQASPVFEARTGHAIDFVVLNHGGIRSIVSKGKVNARTAYQLMPFENFIEVAEMSGDAVLQLVGFLSRSKRAHPISGMQLQLQADGTVGSLKIKGKPLDPNRTYYVASTDYLIQGGERIGFFKQKDSVHATDYLLRNAMIDYFKKVDTLIAEVDDRFIQLR